MIRPPSDDLVNRLKALVGPEGWTDDPDILAPRLVEWRDRWSGRTPLMLSPASTEETAAIVGLCAAAGAPLTVQGGNTGLVGGQIPQGEILLSTRRMRAIRDVDPVDDVLVAEAGVTLAEVQAAAAVAGRRFPLSLASEGTATLGGVVSTNAGGVAVLRFGTARDLVLGLEAVLPNGEIWRGLRRLRKDNTGYDLRGLLSGAEGTLGVITAASVKLFPQPAGRAVAMVGLESPQAALDLLTRARRAVDAGLEAFELMARQGVVFALRNIPGQRDPLTTDPPWRVLLEIASPDLDGAGRRMESLLAEACEQGLAGEAVIAASEAQAAAFWSLRENQSAAQKPEGATWKHDISVPVSQVPRFIHEASEAMAAFSPGCRISAFGHVGDGNIHFDVLRPEGGDDAPHLVQRAEGQARVHDIAIALGGSVSAEHGLGVMKAEEARRQKDPAEVALLTTIRAALDPGRILNPRVLF
ncbi:FAD-binding oxidoreductase [Phenylobacterium sp.]|jgi:FAD/FMN-containing dehydrogenase|uniref:FAD-binding oxidoreductase n=1 Tax=Phenylobacterium sp. TaxID=1871053 RepID=UPI0025DFD74D|nr:FAD-binding oxidoreductase [Phenylobacterium sp.]MCA6284969.1 FAD-binding oxidoreductase [Phenylobacterium sp.]MCA6287882.1 FAD-binding oxidoreductase [Phenylobacterium sp.]MCA6311137.1 FAD-binding oxidoreductase [Phenylobacterium sp.]MCA6324032.1 FAD-binding oxidoreductase [Phenylobacterium sp.]MCA6336488.1 FAD-binding oxidoreductase [Phenylobacterium sp.]